MNEYIKAHYFTNELRYKALNENNAGPRILITGTPQSGEREFCHTLLNYSLKLGFTPIYCDLDLENEISLQGCISASVVDYLVPNDYLLDNGITFFNGSSKKYGNINWSLYESQVAELGKCCIQKLKQDIIGWKKKMNIDNENNDNKKSYIFPYKPTLFSSGMIIHCPMIESDEHQKIMYNIIIKEYYITSIFVIDNEKLKSVIKDLIKDKEITLDLVHRLTGNDNEKYDQIMTQKKISTYFFGPFGNFIPKLLKLNFLNYRIIEIIPSNFDSQMLSIGTSSDLKMIIKLYTANNIEELKTRLVCFVHLDEKDIKKLETDFDKNYNKFIETFSKAPIAYFGFVDNIEKNNNEITIYCPCDENELQHKIILVGKIGNIKYDNNKIYLIK